MRFILFKDYENETILMMNAFVDEILAIKCFFLSILLQFIVDLPKLQFDLYFIFKRKRKITIAPKCLIFHRNEMKLSLSLIFMAVLFCSSCTSTDQNSSCSVAECTLNGNGDLSTVVLCNACTTKLLANRKLFGEVQRELIGGVSSRPHIDIQSSSDEIRTDTGYDRIWGKGRQYFLDSLEIFFRQCRSSIHHHCGMARRSAEKV